jgi:hypothetical protein
MLYILSIRRSHSTMSTSVSEIIKTYHELETRKFSSNVIVRVDVTLDNKGKEQLHKEIIIIPTDKKKEGDKIANIILDKLNKGEL